MKFANYLASVLKGASEDDRKDLWEKIDEKIDCYANGDSDHAVDIITLLWKLSKATEHKRSSSDSESSDDESCVSPLTSFSHCD